MSTRIKKHEICLVAKEEIKSIQMFTLTTSANNYCFPTKLALTITLKKERKKKLATEVN